MEYKLSDLFALQMGKTPARDEPRYWQNGRHSWISIADLSSVDKFIEETKESISDCAVKESNISMIPEGAVVMSFKLSLGKVAITKKAMYSNEAIMAFIPRAGVDISTDYLYYLLKARRWDTGGNKAVKGITLNKATLSSVKVCIHSAEEQRLIVNILDKLKSVIKRRQSQLAKLDKLVKCRFVEMFGDPVLNEKAWPCENFSKYIEFITSGSRGWAKYYSDKGSYFITIKNVKKCNITTENVQYVNPPNNAEATRTKVEEGDLLISITADLGRTGVVTKEIAQYGAYINQHLTCVRIRKGCLHPVYVAHFLETDAGKMQFLSKNQNAVKAGLNFDAIKSIRLLIPPISEQEHFVSFLARIDKLRFVVETSHNHKHFTICGLVYLYTNPRLNLRFA